MDKPTHAVNSSMSCIDLIFCTNLNVISKHGVDVIIFDKCHHDIIYGKINIRVPLPPISKKKSNILFYFFYFIHLYNNANIKHI